MWLSYEKFLDIAAFAKQNVHIIYKISDGKTVILHNISMKQEFINRINLLAKEDEPFLFVINYNGDDAYIRRLSEIDPKECLYDFEGTSNYKDNEASESADFNKYRPLHTLPPIVEWEVDAPLYEDYKRSFDIVRDNMLAGNSYLANLTCKVPVRSNLSLEDIFVHSKGKYKLLLRGEKELSRRFVCFSPESFLRINDGRIYSYPMKGTLDASLPNAEKELMADKKEAAEHATIVDLIRNDLSRVATEVRVDKYRYIDILHTNKGDILQTSSEISGRLPDDYRERLGEIIDTQLPAGSITGAPKKKTVEIIHEAERYERGYYTGIMGIYNNGNLNSAVMIRFVEEDMQGMSFKAGGGITAKSDCRKEYEEVGQKIYLPIRLNYS